MRFRKKPNKEVESINNSISILKKALKEKQITIDLLKSEVEELKIKNKLKKNKELIESIYAINYLLTSTIGQGSASESIGDPVYNMDSSFELRSTLQKLLTKLV